MRRHGQRGLPRMGADLAGREADCRYDHLKEISRDDAALALLGEKQSSRTFIMPEQLGDIGTGDDGVTRELARLIAPFLVQALKPGAVVVSGVSIDHGALCSLALPPDIEPGRHFVFSRVDQFGSDTNIFRAANANAPGERRCILATDC